VLAQEHAQAAAQGARDHQRDEHDAGAGEEHDLSDAPPGAAVEADHVAAHRHYQQVRAHGHERGGVEDHLPRDEYVQRPGRVGARGERHQRHHQSIDETACLPGRRLDTFDELRLGEQEEVVGEQHADADHEVPERVAPGGIGVAVDLLDQHEAGKRHCEAAEGEDGRQRRGELGTVPEEQHHRSRSDRRGDEQVRGAAEERRPGAARDEPRQHEEPRAVANELGERHQGERQVRQLRHVGEQRGPGRRHAAGHDEPYALPPSLPADGQQQRQDQEADRGKSI
jgi:hypothetical protein